MTQQTFWESVLEVLNTCDEEGPLPRKDLEVWAWWFTRLVNVFEDQGWFYRGASIKYQGWSTLLVVKAARQGIPYVVFITERTTTDCMRVFRRLWSENRVEWREDKFG